MKLLATKIIYKGFTLTQVSRDGNIAVYSQVWNGCKNPSTAYEVIRIQHHNGREIMGTHIPPSEYYPRSETWGTCGWTYVDKDSALHKAVELVAA